MARHHVVLARRIGIEETQAAIARGERPRHFMLHVADLLGATLHEPATDAPPARRSLLDRACGVYPATAALADRVVAAAGDDDVIFCNSEAISLPIAARLCAAGRKTRLASLVHNMTRPRIAAPAIIGGLIRRHAELFSVSRLQAETLARLGAGARSVFIEEQIDDAFFTQGPAGAKSRPIIASVGLEQRDYATLAAAAGGLDADIRISAFSKDAKALAQAFPPTPPPNMDQRFYEWPDLVRLYRDCHVVVVPLVENRYAAGITSILEAMATKKPVIASATTGLKNVFADEAAFCWTPPGDAAGLGSAIRSLLDDPSRRATLAARGAALLRDRHREDDRAASMAARLTNIPV